jgi:glutathione S-transferase
MSLPVLYSFRRCPFAMRARFALVAADCACEWREVLLRDKPAALREASPKATVPVLVEADGHVIDQSLEIMLWALRQRDPAGWLRPERGTLDDMLAWVGQCDGSFKDNLDRYKYPNRFEGAEGSQHRDAATAFLGALNERTASEGFLFGGRPALADMAIAPFVRQFAQVDPAWFDANVGAPLRAWLEHLTHSALWERAMRKQAPWTQGDPVTIFPPAEATDGANRI